MVDVWGNPTNGYDMYFSFWNLSFGFIETIDTNIGAEPFPVRVGQSLMVFAVKQDNTLSVQSFW
jgi:hypothetical protein